MSKSHNLWAAMSKQCSTGLKRKKITWIKKISIWHQRHNLQEKKNNLAKVTNVRNLILLREKQSQTSPSVQPEYTYKLDSTIYKMTYDMLKRKCSTTYQQTKKDELKNFLTNLRPKYTKKYFQEDWN